MISVIIPTYNRAEVIQKTLNSLKAQSYTRWECLVVDDGSMDSTEEVIRNYSLKDSRFKLLRRPKNRLKGANACRNYGLEQSKGNYIIWFDSDDIMDEDYLKLQLNNLIEASKNYSICKSKWLTLKGNLISGFRSIQLHSNDVINDYIQFVIFWPINTVCYKKEFLLTHGLQFDETLQQSQEYDFHVKVLQVDKNYAMLDKQLVTVIASKDSVSYSDENTYAKLKSSINVRKRFLRNSDRLNLTVQTKKFLLTDIHRIFQQQTMDKNYSASFYSGFHYLYSHFLDTEIAKKFFFRHFIFTVLICFTYNLFSKGYKLFKKSNTFNYSQNFEQNG